MRTCGRWRRMTDIAQSTIFTLPRADARRYSWIRLFLLALLGWVGAVAYISRFRRHQVAALLESVAPFEVLYWGSVALCLMLASWWLVRGMRSHGGAALIVAAFLLGHELYGIVYGLLDARVPFPFQRPADGVSFAIARLAYGASVVVPMLIAWWAVHGRDPHGFPPLRLGVGDLRAVGRDVSSRSAPQSWLRALFTGYLLACAILFIVMQANVGFRPLLSGRVLEFLPAILVAAAGNAVAEEYIFRGVLQPAFIRAAGIATGLWVQGVLFGMMHWGLSVGILAALPVSMLIGFGSVVWGKAALDTRGMAWVVIAHMMIDVCVMSAFMVPRG